MSVKNLNLVGSVWRTAGCLLLLLALSPSAFAAEPISQKRSWVPLKALAEGTGLLVGAAIKYSAFKEDPEYQVLLLREYNVLVPENELKWSVLRPAAHTYAFERADAMVAFAGTNGLTVRGHTLCWNLDKHQPRWLVEGQRTPEEARELLREHIRAVAGRYRGRIKYWDVVNEAVTNNPRTNAPVLADGYWKRMLGDEYIELAFQWAHEADPDALLFYNDYDKGEAAGVKAGRIYELVKGLVERGVPIHGVGLQMHLSITNPPVESELRANIARLSRLGLEVHITELDVDIEDAPGSLAERLKQQGHIYGMVTRAALSNPKCTALVTWGATDRWGNTRRNTIRGLPEESPTYMLPFDANLKPKPAAYGIAAALRVAKSKRAAPQTASQPH